MIDFGVGMRTVESKAQGLVLDKRNAASTSDNLSVIDKHMYKNVNRGYIHDHRITKELL